jgi:hypothetical protein
MTAPTEAAYEKPVPGTAAAARIATLIQEQKTQAPGR